MHNRAQRGVDERAVPASTLITVADSSRMPRRLSHSNLAVRSCGPYTTCACGTTAMRYYEPPRGLCRVCTALHSAPRRYSEPYISLTLTRQRSEPERRMTLWSTARHMTELHRTLWHSMTRCRPHEGDTLLMEYSSMHARARPVTRQAHTPATPPCGCRRGCCPAGRIR